MANVRRQKKNKRASNSMTEGLETNNVDPENPYLQIDNNGIEVKPVKGGMPLVSPSANKSAQIKDFRQVLNRKEVTAEARLNAQADESVSRPRFIKEFKKNQIVKKVNDDFGVTYN